jgi:predicted MPP superfamily phosphohydrolase
MNRVFVISMTLLILFLIDLYVYQGLSQLTRSLSPGWQQIIRISYWSVTGLIFLAILFYNFGNPDIWKGTTRNMVFSFIFMVYISKLFSGLFLVIDDVVRLGKWVAGLFSRSSDSLGGDPISRSEFLTKTAVIAGTVPLVAMSYGILSGAHDYRIRRKTIYLPNLPKAFDGIRVAQLSDIHTGSFFNRTAVKGGVEMLLKEKPDMVFFTGDLVNNQSSEVKEYIDIFGKVKAPLGVYSVTGNHDYGDYHNWSSEAAKRENFNSLMAAHKEMGYDLLMNENRMVEVDGEKIAILGNENWGAGRFAKYGNLQKAYMGSEEGAVKILLSHDPSHWDAQVRPGYKDIDLMLSGHTHGFQFGVELGDFKWSPAQYAYKQWAGLYENEGQYLYVNRGFGYLGYPGRIGIPPEITILTLKQGNPA